MKKCWELKPENRPTSKEIWEYLGKYCRPEFGTEEWKILELAEAKRQEIIKSEKYLIDENNNKNHP